MLGILLPCLLFIYHINSSELVSDKLDNPRTKYNRAVIGKISTGIGWFSCAVLLNGMMSFASSSNGSLYGESCHQTEPFPSITPLPWIVIPLSFVISIHHSRPEPQALAFVGAIIVPSSCKILNSSVLKTTLLSKTIKKSWDCVYAIMNYLKYNVCFTVRARE